MVFVIAFAARPNICRWRSIQAWACALMGVSRVSPVHDNIAATNLCLPAEQIAKLDAASAPDDAMIYGLFTAAGRQHTVFGGSAVASRK